MSRSEQEIQDKNLNFDLPSGCTAFKRDYSISYEHYYEGGKDEEIVDLIVLPVSQQIYVITKNFQVIRLTFGIVNINSETNSIDTEIDKSVSFKEKLQEIYGT